MQEASFQSVLRIVLIIFLVYFGFKILIKWFGPMILRYVLRKLGNRFKDQYSQASQQHTKEEDDTIIRKNRVKRPKSKETVGEYIDYEEID